MNSNRRYSLAALLLALFVLLGSSGSPASAQTDTAEVSVGPAVEQLYIFTGTPFVYTINVTNLGPAVAEDVTLTSQLPEGVTLDAVNDAAGGSCSIAPGGAGLTCAFPPINPFTSHAVRVTATSAVTVPPNTPVVTSFTVASSTPDDFPNNNTATIEFINAGPPLPTPTPGPADELELAYGVSLDGAQNEIFRQRADGAGLTSLSNGLGDHREFVWSPDGSKLAFTRFNPDDGTQEIYVVGAEGGQATALTNPDGEFKTAPAWSPDGARLVFSAQRPDGSRSGIFVIDADGNNTQRLTDTIGANDAAPAWSPDGARLVFTRSAFDFQTGSFAQSIYVMNADGTNLVKFDNNAGEIDYFPAWSPDGTEIAFVRFPNDGVNLSDLQAARPDGTNRRSLTSDHSVLQAAPRWSPDGSKLTFQSSRADGGSDLNVVNADGTGRAVVFGPAGTLGNESWSPDGTRITFTNSYAEVMTGLYVVNADGTGLVHIGDDAEVNNNPAWSPDGTRIAFTSARNGVGSINLVRPDGADRLYLTDTPGFYSPPKWRPRALNTPAGADVEVALGGVTLTFSSVTQAGQTTVTPVDPNSLQGVPGGYVIDANSLAFEITTTAVYTGPITLGFNVPGVNDPAAFGALRVLHGEPAPDFVDRTILAPDSPSHDFASRTVYARVSSLSPFLVARLADTTGPEITITSPTAQTYVVKQAVAASYVCTDSGSGVLTCAGTVPNGAGVNTDAVGAKTFLVSARDHAGNTSAKSVAYKVAYGVAPTYDQTKVHQSGSTVHLSLRLVDAHGANLSSAGVAVAAHNIALASADSTGPVAEYNEDDPDSNFSYKNGEYEFKLKTKGYAAGTYVLSFRAGADPTTHTIQFRIRR